MDRMSHWFGFYRLALLMSFVVGGVSSAQLLPFNLTCEDDQRRSLPFLNQQVLQWRANSPNQTTKRALIEGVVVADAPDTPKHTRFFISIDHDPRTVEIEVIFNDEFADLPQVKPGQQVIACGDYITSKKDTNRYPASKAGAIIHWLHYNPGDRDGGRHPHGFLLIDGIPYGTEETHSARRKN